VRSVPRRRYEEGPWALGVSGHPTDTPSAAMGRPECSSSRRLRGLVSHVARRGNCGGQRQRQVMWSGVTCPPAAATDTTLQPPLLLGAGAIEAFLANGFLAFRVDDLPRGFHEDFYRKACELKADHDRRGFDASSSRQKLGLPDRRQFGTELAAKSDMILSSARTRGALASLLGSDFAGGAWDGGVLSANDRDQGWHKDNTYEPTRDWSPRQISLFFYPGPCTNNDGPTCFLPGTQYFALDREGLGHGEERLDASMLAPKTAEEWRLATASYSDTRSVDEQKNPGTTYAKLDRSRAEGIPLLGVDGLRERRVTHRGGYIVLWHDNVFHRRARQRPRGVVGGVGPAPEEHDFSNVHVWGGAEETEVQFRPVVRLSFFRTSEPTRAHWHEQSRRRRRQGAGLDEVMDEGAAVPEILTQPQLEWLRGGNDAAGAAGVPAVRQSELSQAIWQLHHGGECARTCAAVRLGRSGQAGAIAALAAALRDGAEAQRRAGCYGLAHGGRAAARALLGLLRQPATALYQTDQLLFALGRAMTQPPPPPPQPCPGEDEDEDEDKGGSLLTLLRRCVVAVGSAMDIASATLDTLLAAETEESLRVLELAATRGNRGYDGKVYAGEVPPHAEADDARGAIAEAVRTLGLLGSVLMRRFLCLPAASAGTAEAAPGSAAQFAGADTGVAGAQPTAAAAALLQEVLARLTHCICEPDRASCFPSRFPHAIRHANAARALLLLCSTTGGDGTNGCCPPAMLPSARAHPEYAQLAQDDALSERVAAGDVASGDLVRLALARLAWRRDGGGGGGLWSVGHEVVARGCTRTPQWAGLGLLHAAASSLEGPVGPL
jgi:hypothetical protein